ncbi:MAG: MBL fold metallo-hydrolase, partial [Syntrophales bacterium]|nr:MBL fold metallo-hydrolase [Syntrophales bacterium]
MFGIPGFTSAYLIAGEELAIVETGPAKSAPLIMEGIREAGFDPRDISYLIVTHVHLDHGGGAGTLVKEMPKARVVVHEKGARHMIDPSRLVKSSRMVFGSLIDEWYGEVLPVEEGRVIPVKEGDIIDLGKGQRLRIIVSPGHASHHICIYSENEGVLFTGDAVGIYLSGSQALIPTTPPPEFDHDINVETIRCFFDLDLRLLCFSHFGCTEKVKQTLSMGIERLMKWNDTVSEMLETKASLPEITERFTQDVGKLLNP